MLYLGRFCMTNVVFAKNITFTNKKSRGSGNYWFVSLSLLYLNTNLFNYISLLYTYLFNYNSLLPIAYCLLKTPWTKLGLDTSFQVGGHTNTRTHIHFATSNRQ